MSETIEEKKINGTDVKTVVENSTETAVEENTDISTEDIVKKAKTTNESLEHKMKKDFVLEKKENINWSKVEFEKDCPEMPALTQDDIGIFSAITNGMIDDETISVWVDIAKQQFNEYDKYLETLKENSEDINNLEKEDKEYLNVLKQGKEESKTLLAVIQTESRKLAKDFRDDKIGENTIKVITMNILRNFAVSKFRYSDIGDNERLSNIQLVARDRCKEIEKNLLNNMYVLPIFEEFNKRFRLNPTKLLTYNKFGANYRNYVIDDILQALRIYVKNIDKSENIKISDIIDKDIENLNYVNVPIFYSYYKYDTAEQKTLDTSKLTDEQKARFENVTNMHGTVSANENNIFMNIYNKCEEFIEKLTHDSEILKNLVSISTFDIQNDKLYNKYINSGYKLEEFEEFIKAVINDTPTINGTHLGDWCNYYSFVSKLIYRNELVRLYVQVTDEEKSKDTVTLHRMGFNFLISLLVTDYHRQYCGFISGISDFAKTELNDNNSKKYMFKSIMNSFILQHTLAFRTDFDKETQNSGHELYELAKTTFGDAYNYIVVDEKDDILLKYINLDQVRIGYYKLIISMINDYISDLSSWSSASNLDFTQMSCITGNVKVVEKKSTNKKGKKYKKSYRR